MSNLTAALIPLILIALAIALSVSAFYGGFHFAYVRFLKKFKPLNDLIVSQPMRTGTLDELKDRLLALKTLNEFLISIKVENEKVKFSDWYKESFFSGGDK